MSGKIKIYVENLKKTFGKLEVLKDISTDIHGNLPPFVFVFEK